MIELYRTAFEIDAPLTDAAKFISDWAAGLFDGPTPDALSGVWRSDTQSLELWMSVDGNAEAFELRLTQPAANSGHWRIETRLACEAGPIFFEAAVQREAPAGDGPVRRVRLGIVRRVRLGIVRRLIEAFSCTRGSIPLSAHAAVVTEHSIEGYLQDVLLNPERTWPMIAVSRRPEGDVALNPDQLQHDLAGVALVAVWDSEVSRHLADAVGRQFACYGGAVRVYRPGLTPGDTPGRHRFSLWSRARQPGFARLLQSQAAEVVAETALPSRCGPIADRVRNAESRRLSEQIEALTRILPNQDTQQTITSLNAELARKDAEIERLSIQVKHLDGILNKYAESIADRPDRQPDLPQTVAETVQLAETYRHLVILESAVAEAGKSNYRQPETVYEKLNQLNELSGRLAEGSVPQGQILGWLRTRGTDTSTESEDTMRRYGDERLFRAPDGRMIEMQMHIKLGGGPGQDAVCRIHFAWSEERNAILVGHVGRHLRTSRS